MNPAPPLRGWRGWLGKPGHSRDQRLTARLLIYLLDKQSLFFIYL